MIISKTPLRMSFLGGGTDLPAFYRKHGGLVVSVSIDKYVFVTVNKKFDDRIRVSYSDTENAETAGMVKHPLVRAALMQKNIREGIEITSIADVPSSGTGLGSSSSFTVALLQALAAFKGEYQTAEGLARDACHIEIDICGEPIGKQDQYAAAYGGLNLIQFHPDDTVKVSPVVCAPEYVKNFESQLLCFYTGRTRSASNILEKQSARINESSKTVDAMKSMKDLAIHFTQCLYQGDVDAMGRILHEGWVLKRGLSDGITDGEIDHYYELARKEGATGGKLLGAGGGGFLLIQAPPDRHDAICHALSGLRQFNLPFSTEGARIIFYHPSNA
jgi:D-glycero-alpha-D-manno-heptose-7-phosphate kinase